MYVIGTKNSLPPYGSLQRLCLRRSKLIVSDTVVVQHNGSSLPVDLCLVRGSLHPVICYNGKSFSLGWRDIITLAKQAGLFDEAPEVPNE